MGAGRDGLELTWPGKYDAQGRRAPLPRRQPRAELREVYGPAGATTDGEPDARTDALWVGDNLDVLDALADARAETVDLCVLDPPFGTGGRFSVVSRVGEPDDDGRIRQLTRTAYDDRWPGGAAGLVAMLDPRLRFIHRLLAPTGSLYVHLDATVVHAVKLLLDEIFGEASFQREIVWRIGWVSGFKTRAKNWIRNHDVILFYTKDPKRFVFEKQYVPHPPGYVRRDGKPPRGPGLPLSDVWNATAIESELSGADSLDSIQIKSFSTEKTGYATQKNESLVERIVRSSSREGDLVADFFCGSGTTLAVARRLGRRVLGADVGRAAIALARKRVWAAAPDVPLAVWSLRSWALGRREPAAVEELAARAPDGAVVVDDEVTEPPSRPARGRGHTAAWGFELPAQIQSVAENGVVVGGVAERGAPGLWIGYPALLDPRTRSDPDAVTSWPRLRVRVDIDDRAVQVTVVGIDDPDAPAELTALNPSPRDLIDAWAVDWAGGEVLRADAVHARTHQRRALPDTAGPHRLTGDGPWTITVRAWDVLHREATLRITLARARAPGLARGQIRVTQARMS